MKSDQNHVFKHVLWSLSPHFHGSIQKSNVPYQKVLCPADVERRIELVAGTAYMVKQNIANH